MRARWQGRPLASALCLAILLALLMFGTLSVGAALALAVPVGYVAIRMSLHPPANAARSWKAGLLFASVGFALLIFECGARVGGFGGGARAVDRFLERFPEYPQVHRFHPSIDFTGESLGDLAIMLPADRAVNARMERFVTDARGLRNLPGAADQPIALLALGDSFGAGIGVSQDESWLAQLGAMTGATQYNLSVPGSPFQEAANLALELPRLNAAPQARLIWMIFSGNDLDECVPGARGADDLDLETPTPRSEIGQLWIQLQNFRERSALRRITRLVLRGNRRGDPEDVIERALPGGQSVLFYAPYAERAKRTRLDVESHPGFASLVRAATRIRELSVRAGLELTIVVAPAKAEVYPWLLASDEPWSGVPTPSPLASALAAALASTRMIDLLPEMQDAARALHDRTGELHFLADDTHLSPAGHRFVAEVLARWSPR